MLFRGIKASLLPSFKLVYLPAAYSFDVEPKPEGGGSSVLVNDLQLEVNGEGRVMYAWGLCPYPSWATAALPVPRARQGVLLGELPDDVPPGASMRLNRERWPVAVDRKQGWVRVGAHETSDGVEFVEFAPGALAGLVGGQLRELWLHPQSLLGT